MKRSEAIAIITNYIDIYTLNLFTDKEEPSWYIAGKILEHLEKAGMFPPNSGRYKGAMDLNWEPEEGFPEKKKRNTYEPL